MHADFSALQAFAGIVTVSVGHCHPRVVDAVKRQSELLQHTTTIYLNPQIALYAKELTDRLPGNLKVRVQTLFRARITSQSHCIGLIRLPWLPMHFSALK